MRRAERLDISSIVFPGCNNPPNKRFLQLNPEIADMLGESNDITLSNIASCKMLRQVNVNNINIPILYKSNEIKVSPDIISVDNFVKMLYSMVITGTNPVIIEYKTLRNKDDIQKVQKMLLEAFGICQSKYVHYLSGITEIQANCTIESYGDKIVNTKFEIALVEVYKGALRDTASMLKLCEVVKAELIKSGKITRNMSQEDKAKVLFNWVCLHTSYDFGLEKQIYTGYAALYMGKAVCQGQTALYNTLLRLFGIECYGISGVAVNPINGAEENHIWTLANINGLGWIHIDVTWGQPLFVDGNTLFKNGINPNYLVNYKMFNISPKSLSDTRTWNKEIYGV